MSARAATRRGARFSSKRSLGPGSGSGDTPEDALSLGGIRETGADVVTRQGREVREDLFLTHPRGQIGKHIADREPGPANRGFPKADLGVDDDPVVVVHVGILKIDGQSVKVRNGAPL